MDNRTWAVVAAGLVMMGAVAMQGVAADNAPASAPTSAPASKPGGEGKTWTYLGGLHEGNVGGFAEDASGTIWAVATGHGVFKSADGGDTWTAFNDGLTDHMVNSIAVSPKTGDIFVGGGGVFKLEKGATSWQPFNKGLSKGALSVGGLTFTKAGDLYAGQWGAGISRLPAGGTSWQATGKIPPQVWNSYAMSAGGRVWASGIAYIASSADDGATWEMATIPTIPHASLSHVMCIAIDDAAGILYAGGRIGKWGGDGGIYRSTDDGKTWSKPGLLNEQVNAIVVHGKKVFAGTRKATDFGGLFVSEDQGATWTPITKGFDDLWDVHSITVTSKGIFVGANGGYRSTDGGASFQKLNIPAVQYCGSIVVMDNGDIYTGGDMFGGFNAHGVSKLAHGATAWTKLNKGLLSMDITTLIRNRKGELLAGDKYRTTYRLIGNGEEWTKSSLDRGLGAQELILAGNGDVLAGTAGTGSFISSDDGSTFGVKSQMLNCQVNDFYLAPNGDILAGTEGGGEKGNWLMISTDNGKTYSAGLGTPPSARQSTWAVGSSPTGTILVSGGGAIDEYLGDGKWRKASSGIPPALGARDFIMNKAKTKVFVATTRGVFYSTDPQQGWQAFSDGLPPVDVHSLAFDSQGYLYAGTVSGLFKTTTPQDK